MRVGISGTHGTGKTTLAGALCAHLPGHVTADEPYYRLCREFCDVLRIVRCRGGLCRLRLVLGM